MKRILTAIFIFMFLFPLATEAGKNKESKNNPVVANINGKDIKLSEFEYLYNKNKSQQVNPQTIDEYVDMFVVYKLKVADAEAAGIDTTASFIREYQQYVNDLAVPYITDQVFADSLKHELYEHLKTNRKVAHIQLPGGELQKERMDSLRNAILTNGSDFGMIAAKFSIDRNARKNNGVLGWLSVGSVPYEMEEQIYNTPVGGLSEVFQTRYGTHLFKILEERPARGQILASHILKQTNGKSPEEKAQIRHQMDSIHDLLINGADFSEIATRESEDPGSKVRGGSLGWFGAGKMVPEFEETAFSLSKGEVSDVIETQFGYHIIKLDDEKGTGDFESEMAHINEIMARDGRARMPVIRKLRELRSNYDIKLNPATRERVNALFMAQGTNDSIAMANIRNSDEVVASVGPSNIILSQIASAYPQRPLTDAAMAMLAYDDITQHYIDEAVKQLTIDNLPEQHPEFANLINEYRDGILLYEISNQNVWGRSTTDTEGLQKYFEKHKDEFSDWTEPRYKGYVALVVNDSVADVLKNYIKTQGDVQSSELVKNVKARFQSKARIDKVLAKKGDNQIVDYLVFGGPKPEGKSKWQSYFPLRGQIIDQPEEAADVKGAVSTAWQKELETEWIESLRSKYPVTLNKKVLKKVK